MAEPDEKPIEIKSDDVNVIDSEFSGNRENFETEMENMQEEHNRVINALLNCRGDYSNIQTPLILDEGGGKVLRLRFDMNHFAVKDITIRTVKQTIFIQASSVEETKEEQISRKKTQQFTLPDIINMETLRISLSTDSVLSVIGPLPPSKPIKD